MDYSQLPACKESHSIITLCGKCVNCKAWMAGLAPAGRVSPSAARYRKQREKHILVLLWPYHGMRIEKGREWNCSFTPNKGEIRRWEIEGFSYEWERPAHGLELKKKATKTDWIYNCRQHLPFFIFILHYCIWSLQLRLCCVCLHLAFIAYIKKTLGVKGVKWGWKGAVSAQ